MKVSYVLLISLIIVGVLFVPAVSAENLVLHDSDVKQVYFVNTDDYGGIHLTDLCLHFYRIQDYPALTFAYVEARIDNTVYNPELIASPNGQSNVSIKYGSTVIGRGTIYYSVNFADATPKSIQVWIDIDTWNIGTLTGQRTLTVVPENSALLYHKTMDGTQASLNATHPIMFGDATANPDKISGHQIFRNNYEWTNFLNINDDDITLIRSANYSRFILDTGIGRITDNSSLDKSFPNPRRGTWTVINSNNKAFSGSLSVETETPHTVTNRTGTVTMTDHNGTSITGFEVTAENFYTGQSYTFSTDTDVAVISLPMDRTTTIRNPQTGVYEETPVGYYRFFGQKSGYKMLNEDGIQVAVMPQQYGSYQLCDILVTPESGYLTGQHKFQIRSRSDNSVLQTGTISAKSATTNQWYNTTVTGGIATLILPYDTSNPISQYAGNYYVYATSPGYEDSDYGTQIVVMPHTVSEINTILLTPIGGIPAAGNVTLRILAFSEAGPGVANASIFIAGVLGAGSDVWDTYTASSTGYLEVSVPGNSTYDIVASAEGYYDSARRIEVFTESPGLIEIKLYFSGAPTVEPTTQPTGWPTTQPTTTPTGGIPDDDDGSESFLMQAVRGIGKAFGVGFSTAKLIFGMLLALSIGFATAKHLRGGAAEFGLGLVGGTMLGVLIGLLPVWTVVVLLLIVGLYIGNRYIGGANNG